MKKYNKHLYFSTGDLMLSKKKKNALGISHCGSVGYESN